MAVHMQKLIVIHAGETAAKAHAALKAAVDAMEGAEHCAVLWFAEIRRRRLFRELGYSSIHQYASEALGFSPSRTYQFLQLAESLGKLPELRQSVASGEIGWTKAREVAKVATRRSELHWIEEAKRTGRRELAQKVAETRARARAKARKRSGAAKAGSAEPVLGFGAGSTAMSKGVATVPNAGGEAGRADSVDSAAEPDVNLHLNLNLRFTPEKFARYEALVEKIRKVAGSRSDVLPRRLSREDLVLAALEDLLARVEEEKRTRESDRRQGNGDGCDNAHGDDPGDASAPAFAPAPDDAHAATDSTGDTAGNCTRVQFSTPYQIIIYKCVECGKASVATARGQVQIGAAAAAVAECDGRILAPGQRNRATIPPAVRRGVLARDGFHCQAPGCGNRRFLEVHHIVPREQGGSNKPRNLTTLCTLCHGLVHEKGNTAAGVVSMAERAVTREP